MVFGFASYEPLKYENYVYPWWGNLLGWCIAMSSVLCIPGVAIFKILTTPGTFAQVGYHNGFFLFDERINCPADPHQMH